MPTARAIPFFLLASLASGQLCAQVASPSKAELLDRVVAVVNGDVILESDVEQQERFAAFQPFNTATSGDPRRDAFDRLTDRTLIEQQMRTQAAMPEISTEALDKDIAQLRKSLPECGKYACATDAGWAHFCNEHGFTPEEIADRWRVRMELLAFIEQRFRTGIRISQPEIESYYTTAFVPKFKERNLTPPSLATVSSRIEEILLQQRVNGLLADWLTSLRDQGSVQLLDPTLAAPPTPAEKAAPK